MPELQDASAGQDPCPMFSVGMPVYNHERFVGQAIRSVLDQDFGDFELIVVDDGSTDGSGAIIDELARTDSRIRVFHQANAGVQAARNTIVSLARAGWMTWLDSDDLWYKPALGHHARYIADHPQSQFIYGYSDRLQDDVITRRKGEFQDGPTGPRELFGRIYLSHLCVCYRRELFYRAGGYDLATKNADDYDLYLRMSLHCKLEPLKFATGLRRRHPGCMSAVTGRSRMFEAEVLRRFAEDRGGSELVHPELIARRLAHVYCSSGEEYLKAGYFREALAAVRMALRYRRTPKILGFGLLALCLWPLGRRDARGLPRLS